jgi:hypothetical protein
MPLVVVIKLSFECFDPAKNIHDSTDNYKNLRENGFCTSAIESIPANCNCTISTQWTDPLQHSQGN